MAWTLYISPLASALLLIHFGWIYPSRMGITASAAIAALCWALSALFFISDDITGDGITEATIFHLTHGVTGIDPLSFPKYLISSLLGLVAAVAFCVWAWRTATTRLRCSDTAPAYGRIVNLAIFLALATLSVAVHPATHQAAQVLRSVSASGIDPQALNAALRLDVTPLDIAKTRSPSNLVFIYAESLERTFFDQSRFPGLAPKLRELEQSSLSFHGIRQAPLTEWTMAGMVASQCGVPLSPIPSAHRDAHKEPKPGSACIGDYLHHAGYRMAYIGGADAAFSGKGRFYADHGFDHVLGKAELLSARGPNTALSQWGIYDDDLLDEAYQRYQELERRGQPFALFILTLDTHPPSGHRTPACAGIQYGDGTNSMLNAVQCADRLIARFIHRIEQTSSDEPLIVLASDHLQMRSDISKQLEGFTTSRENMFMLRGPNVPKGIQQRDATTLDIAPTVLSAMGWDAGAIGLGRSLLGNEPTLSESLGSEHFFSALQSWRLNDP